MSDDTPVPSAPDAAPNATPTAERVAKVIARSGVASRRDAEKLILEGKVAVNGKVIDTPALDVTPNDKVTIDGKPIDAPQETRVWLYYKPLGLVTTEKDDQGRRTIFDEMPEGMPRVLNVGRLDLNSEGLLLLTNDGGLKRRLEHPETGWLRKYRVRVNGRPTNETFNPLREGITVDGENFQPMEVVLDRQQGANAWLTVGIREGKNREIRRAMTAVGMTVNRLIRVSYGPFRLNDMNPGDVTEIKRKILRDQLGDRLLTGLDGGRPPRSERMEPPRRGDAPRRGPKSDGRSDARSDDRSGPRKPFTPREGGPRGDRPRDDGPQKGFGRQRDFSGEGAPAAGKPRWSTGPKEKSAGYRSHREESRTDGDTARGPRKPYGDRPERDDRDRKPYGDKKPYGGRAGGSDRSFGDRPDRGDRKPYGDKKPYGDRAGGPGKPVGDRPDRGDRKPYGDRAGGPDKSFGDRPDRGDRKPYGDKKPYGDRAGGPGKPVGDCPDRGDRKPYGDKKPYGDRAGGPGKSFGDRPDRGDRKPYGERSGDRSFGDKPFARKPQPRDDQGGERRERFEGGKRTEGGRTEGGPRGFAKDGFKPRTDRDSDDKRGAKPAGFKSAGFKSGGFKSEGFKSHGGPKGGKPRAAGFKSHGDSARPDGPRPDRSGAARPQRPGGKPGPRRG